MAHEFLRNDVLMTLSHRAEILGPYQRHSLQASVSEDSAAQRSAPGGSPVISWTSPRWPRLTRSGHPRCFSSYTVAVTKNQRAQAVTRLP